jgi:hypothetical protein
MFLLAMLAASLLALLVTRLREGAPQPERVQEEEPLVWRPENKRRRRAAPMGLGLPAAEACAPHARERCHAGDVWSFDSCGAAERKVEECGARLCAEDECQTLSMSGCKGPPEGVCVGDRVELCIEGKPYSVDCGAQGLRCANGAEGAACAPLIPQAERCAERAAFCEGDTLYRCLEGRIDKTDCAAALGRCVQSPAGGEAACVRFASAVIASCGPCGCAATSLAQEQFCDGRDDDGDGLLDEELDCGAISLIAFRVTSAGKTGHSEDGIREEVAALNRIFAASEHPGALQFKLDSIIELPQPELMTLEEDAFKQLASDPMVHPQREGFYVPVVFTDNVLATGGVPKPGMSTLPNATCGGIQDGWGPEVGLVAVAKARYPTTLAHEIGHFLGLCHTHDTQHAPLSGYADAQNALQMCQPACLRDGDGICDTPLDPGPNFCPYDQICHVACATGASPDVFNLMSYYADCRETFSAQQMALMQHTAALRRGWRGCFGDNCACRLSGELDCPAGMACRPRADVANAGRCTLEGPRELREECHGMHDCRGSAICVGLVGNSTSHCARLCGASSDDCHCMSTTEGLRICQQDLMP